MRFRITVRGDHTAEQKRLELRGYADMTMGELGAFAAAMMPFGTVIGSPAEDDFDPFKEHSW